MLLTDCGTWNKPYNFGASVSPFRGPAVDPSVNSWTHQGRRGHLGPPHVLNEEADVPGGYQLRWTAREPHAEAGVGPLSHHLAHVLAHLSRVTEDSGGNEVVSEHRRCLLSAVLSDADCTSLGRRDLKNRFFLTETTFILDNMKKTFWETKRLCEPPGHSG